VSPNRRLGIQTLTNKAKDFDFFILLNDYNELEIYGTEKMPSNERFVLLAESFSGPVALNIAAKGQMNVVAVMLVATFIKNPLHFNFLRFQRFIGASLFRLPIPRSFIRNFLLGKDASETLVSEFFDVLNSVNPRILAHRLRLILHANAKQALVECPVPILYLRATEDKVITPILHLKAKIATKWISRTIGKSGFGFYMCKIKELKNVSRCYIKTTTRC
jgi:pimeloyl-ACP methyl ester carboxylesterase